jgi:hypothetical protein
MGDKEYLNIFLSTTILSTAVVKSLGILVEEFTTCDILYLTSSLPGFLFSLRVYMDVPTDYKHRVWIVQICRVASSLSLESD